MASPSTQPDPAPPSPPESDDRDETDRLVLFFCIVLAMFTLTAVVWITRPRPPRIEIDKPRIAFRVNINTADPAALQLLPGVGPALAEKIVIERRKSPFTSVADLERVNGIGFKTAARLAPHIVFESPPAPPEVSPPVPPEVQPPAELRPAEMP